ncbi:MAG TPA: response regulator, partial [Kiritimatiellia bacterium]|nr:response regulator [Kiritimatiellia bacterium]
MNASDRGHETIVVADDDDGVRFISKRILMDAGYCVLEARNGQEAVDLVSTNTGQVDGVMLDIAMPLMDGIEARDRISEIAPGMPILFVSALM